MSEAIVAVHTPNNPVADPPADVGLEESLIAFAPRETLPVQVEHWLRKRQIAMIVSESPRVDIGSIRASGARFALIDIDTQDGDASIVRQIRSELPHVRVVVTTARGDAAFVQSLTEAGASGVVVKRPYVADLALAIQAAGEGRSFVSGQPGSRDATSVQITARERQVLELMANGYSNQAIGVKLSISVKTVEAHRARLFKKLGASNVADAVLLAIRVGLVTP
jgi:DNA-binding NarL/FixJ family response regulator